VVLQLFWCEHGDSQPETGFCLSHLQFRCDIQQSGYSQVKVLSVFGAHSCFFSLTARMKKLSTAIVQISLRCFEKFRLKGKTHMRD